MLSIFGHRFMGIAESMGKTLQRTSVSVNIKEVSEKGTKM
jgi:5-oxoprolinase (ATP-hydrolysing)